MYKIKIVDFDSKTDVKQATLRDVKWASGEVRKKSLFFESSVLEIFGKSILDIKEAFDNNGVVFYAPIQTIVDGEEVAEEKETLSPEFFVEIGKCQEFKNSKFYDINRLEMMILEYDYKLNELINENLAIYLIHHELDFMEKYPNLWREIQKNFNDPQIFIFLTIDQNPQILPQIDTEKLWEDSYKFRMQLWKMWGVETLTLDTLYEVLRFNIMI